MTVHIPDRRRQPATPALLAQKALGTPSFLAGQASKDRTVVTSGESRRMDDTTNANGKHGVRVPGWLGRQNECAWESDDAGPRQISAIGQGRQR